MRERSESSQLLLQPIGALLTLAYRIERGTSHLGRTLEFIKLVQDKRDNNRSQAIPAGDGPSRQRRKPAEKKSQRSLNGDDMLDALKTLQSRSEEMFGTR